MKKTCKKKTAMSKLDIAVSFALVASILFFVIYNCLLKLYFNVRYDHPYFLYRNIIHYLSIPFLCLIIAEVAYFFSDQRKMASKKYIIISSILSAVVLLITIVCSCNIWVVSDKSISYNTLFTDEKIVYDYNDIDNVTLFYKTVGIKTAGHTPAYIFHMSDGEDIEICLLESYFNSYDSFIEFDKKISDKREISGDFISLEIPDEINEYYRKLFDENK